ncbi:MAG TPA: 50S ribosomal protein L32 [Anaerolineae bacterium]
MPPLPKRKLSKGRTARRRAHLAMRQQNLTECPQCHKLRLPHTVCPNCGYYGSQQVVQVKSESK